MACDLESGDAGDKVQGVLAIGVVGWGNGGVEADFHEVWAVLDLGEDPDAVVFL